MAGQDQTSGRAVAALKPDVNHVDMERGTTMPDDFWSYVFSPRLMMIGAIASTG